MKKLLILLISIFFFTLSHAQETVKVTFKYNFINSIKGYTYDTKLVLERDGKKIGESKIKNQEIPNEVTFTIPKGNATLKATLYALYNGKWEARTDDNGYSFDCVYTKFSAWDKNATINLTADIENFSFDATESFDNNNTYNDIDDFGDVYNSLMDVYYNGFDNMVSDKDYKDALAKLNRYLTRFKEGYYGTMEIKDGYLYDNYQSGKYSKIKVTDIDKVIEVETGTEVAIKCKNNSKCVYSTYTNDYHDEMPFSNKGNKFNTQELIDLINNVLNAYNKSSNNKNTDYKTALNKVNKYLKTFDNGYYGYLEVKDGYLYDRFKSGKYSKAKIEDLGKAKEDTPNKKVVINCFSNQDCVYSTYTELYHSQMTFSQTESFNTQELINLLNDFIKAYKGY
ncbi:MAG: hypothetical protein H6553_02555 [Chitinophagales bacterium]|nr:hypothetical protein [Chitinophagales bacterium]